ncbi:glycosyltransferase family protein [Flavobacterium cheonhonense]|uniref:Glycosyltransferase family protein n=1 Tax=Flavobacterium cheonhonense TaxID=706185 RepID=A0ABP7TQ89_9FLAO|nr:glycosyltransferase family protein [Flavobacterium cheonhonense]
MVAPKVILVTQARIGSSRFPEKVLQKLGDDTLLGVHLKRLKKSVLAQKIMVATTLEPKSKQIAAIANQAGVSFYHGSTEDVLDRFYKAVVDYQPDYVVRVTSDCPLIDASLIDAVIEMTITNKLDYGANVLVEHFPDGQDVEVFTFAALEQAWREATLLSDREHVTPYLRKNADVNGGTLFKAMNFAAPDNYNKVRMTVDEPSDLATVALLIAQLGTDKDWKTYTDYILAHQDALSNQSITRNEGYLKSLNQDTHE